MTIPYYNGAGAIVATTNGTFTVPAPSAQTNLDINFIIIAAKPWDIDFYPPSGWEKISSNYNGSVAPTGEDSGTVRVTIFRGFGHTGDVQMSAKAPISSMIAQMISFSRTDGDGWLLDFAYGNDTTYFPSYAVAGDVNVHATADDMVLAITALANNSVSNTPLQTYPGLSLDATVALSNQVTAVGTNCALRIDKSLVLSGTQTAPPTYVHTSLESNWGSTIFMRIHSSPATITLEPIDPMSHNAGYRGFVDNVSQYDYYFIQRVEVSGRYPIELVRGGGFIRVEGRSDIPYYDYEFHFTDKQGVMCVYRNELYLYKHGFLQDVLFTPEYIPEIDRQNSEAFEYMKSPMSFIKDVTTPALNMPVTIKNIKGYNREARVLGKYSVIGRKNPLVITDVTSGMTGEMEVLVHVSPSWSHGFGTANRDFQIKELIDQGSVYYYQGVLPMFTGIDDFYFVVEDVSFERLNESVSPFSGLPITVWTIKFTEVDRPANLDIAVGGGTWTQVDGTYTSWALVDQTNNTFLELYQRLDVGGFHAI